MSGQLRMQQQQLDQATAAQERQAQQITDRERRTAAAEAGQRAVRSGRRRGLLAYVPEDGPTLGGSSA